MTLLQRLSTETPAFWKRMQLLFVALAAIVSYLSKYHIVPEQVFDFTSGLFLGVAAICQFAVKDIAIAGDMVNNPMSALMDIPEVLNQIGEIHKAITAPVTVPPIEEVISKIESVINPPEATPIAAI